MKKTKVPTPTDILVQNITIRPIVRRTQSIEDWKKAISTFENPINPSRVLLYDMYESITLDGQIESTWGKRQDQVLNKDLLFVKDGKEDEEINKLLCAPSMRTLIKDLHNSIAWGFTLIQVNNIYYNEDEEQYVIDYDLIPRKHVHPERDFQCISKEQSFCSKDYLYKNPPLSKYMMWAGEPNDKGLLIKAAQYVIYKRGGIGDWAELVELFGRPFREAKYDGYNDATRIALERAMEDYGGAAYAILPKDAEFKIHEASSNSGSSTLNKDFYNACNAEISKAMLGNTLTTEQGDKGARSLGEVHKEGEDDKNRSDEKFIIDLLNGKFRSILKTFGFNVQGGQIWYKSAEKDWDKLGKKWTVVSGIANKVPVSDDYIYEEFDIPKPDNYDQLKQEMLFDPLCTVETPIKEPVKKSTTIKNRIKDFFV